MEQIIISIITSKGKTINKRFTVCNQEDVGYVAGYVQACKDKGAIVKIVSPFTWYIYNNS